MKPHDLAQYLNFKYYLISSSRELEVFAPQPQYLDPVVFNKMVDSASVLYRLVERIVNRYLIDPLLQQELLLPEFPFRQRIINLPGKLPPFFWVRYDAFERERGGIFFSEFNYDKPCMQREIVISDFMNPPGNPNRRFIGNFLKWIQELWQNYGNGAEIPGVGILVDPNHYEETHLAFLYADLLKSIGYECIILGGHNLKVQGETLSAFGKPLDLLLRQYPGEFSHEINDYSRLLDLVAKGRVLVLNDPRAIVPQAKSVFAYLWQLLIYAPELLNYEEAGIIRETIPFTTIFKPSDKERLLSERESWVLKSVFGRYSESVYIGAMMNGCEWQEAIEYVIKTNQPHIMQEFVPIKRRIVPQFNGAEYVERAAFGNYGIYFTCGEFSGTCVRWSTDYLSLDEVVWFTPLGVQEADLSPLKLEKWSASEGERRDAWVKFAEIAAFNYSYSTSYTAEYESFTLEPIIMPSTRYQEIIDASERLARLFVKTRNLICSNYNLFAPLLGLPESLNSLLEGKQSDWLSFIARFDWAIDRRGRMKLLELNTDTPAGLESYGLNKLVHDMHPNYRDPNNFLPELVREKFIEMINNQGISKVGVLGLVAMAGYEEDWANILQIGSFLTPLVERVVYGDISGLTCPEGKPLLYGKTVDFLYRYYPLDWWAEEDKYGRLLSGLTTICMANPPAALITQSKAFLAIVWQLLKEGFYSSEEKELAELYLVPTFLEWQGSQCIIKPYMEREGKGVFFSKNLKRNDILNLADQNLVYQETVDIYPLDITLNSTYDKRHLAAYPILGVFVIGDKFGGLYTRLGPRITDRFAVVAPTFIEE